MKKHRDRLLICIVVIACLLPFVAKPFHVDDPMYLWAAQQITSDPFDFYGFDVNWYGYSAPMYEINKNPPLVSFYLAAVGSLLGWSEAALHLGMMLPALALMLGSYALASRLCRSPLLASLAAWLTPVALVSSTTLMSDVLMLSLWVWAAFLWLRGLETRRAADLVGAALLMGLCPLAKYFGLALLPLLATYAFLRERRVSAWAWVLLIPLGIVAGYDRYLAWRYDWSPLGDAASYALRLQSLAPFSLFEQGLVGLLFIGGGLLTTALFAPWLQSRRGLAAWAVALGLSLAGVPLLETLGAFPLSDAGGARWLVVAHVSIFGLAGAGLVLLAAREPLRERSPEAILLALWLLGVWFFCSFTNWTPTARAVLPMAPAAGILLARALERRSGGRSVDADPWLALPLLAGLGLALAVAYGDLRSAGSAREAAEALVERHGQSAARLYFQGAWGFQHYMEAGGAARIDLYDTSIRPGDLIATPGGAANLVELDPRAVRTLEQTEFPSSSWVATMSPPVGAGFYAGLRGPLPFAFGPNPPERYRVQQSRDYIRMSRESELRR